MRGSLRRRYAGSWSIILDLGNVPDPATGKLRRKQKWITFRGTKKQAEDKLTDLLKAAKDGTYVDASKLTAGEWLTEWFRGAQGRLRQSTQDHYASIITNHLLPAPFAGILLQKVRSTHLEQYYAASALAPATLGVHHAIISKAFRKAKKDNLIASNPALDLDTRPRRPKGKVAEDARRHCWTGDEAKAFLAEAKQAGPQPAAFYSFLLDSGARKSEAGGLHWTNVDLDAGSVSIVEQLLKGGPTPEFGPTKTGLPRTVRLAAETVQLLREHKRHQAELKMANRQHYQDHGLVFAKEWGNVRKREDCLGQPLQLNNIGQREFSKLIKAAGVKAIKLHGTRHTCATLLLKARVPVHVVSERLGHSKVSMTMEIYAHVLPDMQEEAAGVLGTALHG